MAALRHLDLTTFSPEQQTQALEALREGHPNEADVFECCAIDHLTQTEVAIKLGITQGAVSKRLKRADEFLSSFLLGLSEPPPAVASFAATAKMLNLSRKELAKRLVRELSYGEIGEALGKEPSEFAEIIRLAVNVSAARLKEALRLVPKDEF